MSSDLIEHQGPSASRTNAILALGRRMAEQYQRDNGSSYALASLAYPTVCKQAMQAAEAEEQYYAKCQALGGISPAAAQQILTDTIARAERRQLPMNEVWERAWREAIETSIQ